MRASRFSSRLPPRREFNRITETVHRLRHDGVAIIDLTESNPTQVNLPYPERILQPLADVASLSYRPDPRGLLAAREAVAADSGRRGVTIHPADVVLAASTSESYSWLFKLTCDPGDAVLVPSPSYPLFEHLTRLEGIEAAPYRLEYHGRWEIDVDALHRAPSSTRAVVVVSPNNPTGSYVTAHEFDAVLAMCRTRDWILIADEVFADYPLETENPLTDLAARSDVLSFTLGGASKTIGLPQVKLGWLIAGGPVEQKHAALETLDHVADTFLSVSTPAQVAAASLLRDGAVIRNAVCERVGSNLRAARRIASSFPSCQVLRVEGGWSMVVRVPATRAEESMVLDLLTAEQVLVHPGYFFDFPREAFIVISLLPEADKFADAFKRTLAFLN